MPVLIRTAVKARIVEVFSSLQGEGTRLGERQIFVRFGGCNMRCAYCDEPDTISLAAGKIWDIERLQDRLESVGRQRRHSSITWTGGEPLLHAAFLERMLPWARARGYENVLETNGILLPALKRVRPWLDAAAVDIKLPSATGRAFWGAHARFLAEVPPQSFVKVVLSESSTEAEFERVLSLLNEHAPHLPLLLQPATPGPAKASPPPPARAAAWLKTARKRLKDVRLGPQWHPVWRMK